MKYPALLLAAATLSLAAVTFYLAHALTLERARTERALATATSLPASAAPPTAPTGVADATSPRAVIDIPVPPEATPSTATQRQRPEQPHNPALDTARVAELKAAFAPVMQEMVVYAGLNAYESERLVDLTAEAMVRGQELSQECKSTPGCDMRAMQTTAQESLKRELERILGADKMRRLDTYDELRRVRSFRGQLPAGHDLSETTTTRLGTVLAEERARHVDRSESASAFNQRMYDRAAEELTAEQLAFFKQRQESAFGRE